MKDIDEFLAHQLPDELNDAYNYHAWAEKCEDKVIHELLMAIAEDERTHATVLQEILDDADVETNSAALWDKIDW